MSLVDPRIKKDGRKKSTVNGRANFVDMIVVYLDTDHGTKTLVFAEKNRDQLILGAGILFEQFLNRVKGSRPECMQLIMAGVTDFAWDELLIFQGIASAT